MTHTPPSGTARHPRLPVERFYWAILTPDFPLSSSKQVLASHARDALEQSFAAQIPGELTDVAAAYAPLTDGRVVACAFPTAALAEHPEAVTLCPAALPEWLDSDADAEQLNVLVGQHEPSSVRSARKRRSLSLTTAAALAALGIAFGFERRTTASHHSRAAAESAQSQLLTSAPPGIRPEQLDAELARLRATRNREASAGLTDVSGPLASVLARWPHDLKAQVQSISAAPGQVSIAALLPDHQRVESLSAAMSKADGWEAAEPQTSTTPKGVQTQLMLKAEGGRR